jgi:hypothetical protein
MYEQRLLIPLLAVACLASGVEARAQPDPEQRGERVRKWRRGSHFIAEINVGSGLDGGMSVGGLLGVGGKLKGFPPRFYLIAEYAHLSRSADGTLPDLPINYAEAWRYNDAALGLRIYFPVLRRVRLLVDLMGGFSRVSGALSREGMNEVRADGWHPLGQLATGLQIRPFFHLSLGVRAKIAFTGGGTSALLADSELLSPRVTLTGGLTWHF